VATRKEALGAMAEASRDRPDQPTLAPIYARMNKASLF
jgi:hypothetical protein